MSVVAVVTCEAEAAEVTLVGWRVARATGDDLCVLGLAVAEADARPAFHPLEEALPDTAAPWLARTIQALDDLAHDEPVSDPETARAVRVETVATGTPETAVLGRLNDLDADYVVVGARRDQGDEPFDGVAHRLFERAPVHALMVRVAADSVRRPWRRILVPTAGGPNARRALRLAADLVNAHDDTDAADSPGTVVPLRVQAADGELAREVGARLLSTELGRAGMAPPTPRWSPRVELGASPETVIADVADEGFDVVLLGASRMGGLRRQLFSAVPERQLAGVPGPAVMVVRRRWPVVARFRAHISRWLDAVVPQLTRDDRVSLYARIESGSAWRFDFMALMGFSTAIATLGLLQSSAAVVIGAMLVAPLMTPILGAGLALVQGNLPLLRQSVVAVTLGYLLALVIGFLGAKAFPIPELTSELLARGGPTLIDLGVGWFSGAAAAYCMGRPGLVAALPGVAIAAALVPPIATMGASLALDEPANAAGAGLLFGTNVVAIVLGAAVALWSVGVRRKPGPSTARRWAQLGFAALLLGAAALAVPLSEPLRRYRGLTVASEERLTERMAREPAARVVDVEARMVEGRPSILVRVEAATPLPTRLIDELVAIVRTARNDDPVVRIHTTLVVVDRD